MGQAWCQMANLQTFRNESFGEIRALNIDGEPWFVGKDVADSLGYERTDNAIKNHVDEEDKLTHQISASGQNRNSDSARYAPRKWVSRFLQKKQSRRTSRIRSNP